jgi:PmbA protein
MDRVADDAWIDRAVESAERVLARLGVARFEICADEISSAAAEAKDGVLEVAERSVERSVGIRVLEGGIGFSGITEPSEDDIVSAVEDARAEARRSRAATIQEFARPEDGSARIERGAPLLLDPRARATSRPELRDAALSLEAKTCAAAKQIARVRPARVEEEIVRIRIRTSGGVDRHDVRSRAVGMVGAVAERDDDARSAFASTSASSLEALDLDRIARESAEAAERLLGAAPFKTARVPIILAPQAVAELAQVLVNGLHGDRIERGASFFTGRLHQPALAQDLSIGDDPLDADLDGAASFDGEGLPTFALPLIDRGVVAAFLDDRESAARAGRRPNARAVRACASVPPGPGAHTIVIRPGEAPLEELYRRAEGGLYVHELSGTHTINEVTGELSLGVTGWVVRERTWAEPVEGATVSGTLLQLLSASIGLSAETKRLGGIRAPWLWLESAQVASG